MYVHTDNKQNRLFLSKLFLVLVLCVGIFVFSAIFMNQKSSETINNIGNIYMHSMSEEIRLHFSSTIDLRFSQLKTLISSIDPTLSDPTLLKEFLTDGARIRGFEYLAFYTADGNLETIFGEELELEDPEAFLESLRKNEQRIDTGVDSAGNKQVIIGLPSAELNRKQPAYIALIAGLSESYIRNTLSSDVPDSPVYSHIIHPDGSFAFQNGDSLRDNYFDRLYTELSNDAENHIQEIQSALTSTQHYSAVITTHGERRHLHCTKLAYSDWFLIVIMPYSELDVQISQLNYNWVFTALGGCTIVILALIWVFISYLKEMKQKMAALDQLSQEALHASKAKSEFLSNMSHDIRTPMNAIVGMTSIAVSNIDDKEQVKNCLRKITISSRHLLGLINDVLDMSKIESGKLTLSTEHISLREVIDSVVSIIQPQVNVKQQSFDVFIWDISTEDVCCDSVRLNQILLNILGNSVKFTPAGGSIRLSLYQENSPKGDSYVRVHLLIKDTGIGMSPEFLEKIFDAFSRADSKRVQKTEGSGLGMAITKYIIDAMGGTIQIESELDKGSSFHVTLDLEKAQIQESDMVLPNRKMLVVDDDSQLCESTIASLHSMGIDADWALDAKSALKMLECASQEQDEYQIILLDWKLPEMDGITLIREIRKTHESHIPILLTSAYDWSDIEEDAKAAGATGFIGKPLFRSTLFYGLKPYLADSPQETPEADAAENLHSWNILLAEDNDLNWEIANELLSDFGLDLDWAENGQICLEKFMESEAGYYDAILMDIRMPVMNGLEASRAIRALDRADAQTIPIIAMTADAFSEDVQNCLNSGMNAHTAKPIDIHEVMRLLKKHIQHL